MLWIILGILYFLLLAFLLRFFQSVHGWDDQIRNIEQFENRRAQQPPISIDQKTGNATFKGTISVEGKVTGKK